MKDKTVQFVIDESTARNLRQHGSLDQEIRNKCAKYGIPLREGSLVAVTHGILTVFTSVDHEIIYRWTEVIENVY